MPSNHLILCRALLLLPPILPASKVFSSESTLHMRWPKYWSFSFSISPSKEHPGLISFRMDWLDLLVVQGTLKSLLQHHSSKASILLCSAFFTVQLSHPYMTTGKTIALTKWTFVGKIIIKLLCHPSAFCCCSFTKSCLTLCNPMDHIAPGSSVFHYLLSLLQSTSTESVMLSNHLIFCVSLPFLLSVFPGITVFSSESIFCILQPKYWSFSFSISPSSEYSG